VLLRLLAVRIVQWSVWIAGRFLFRRAALVDGVKNIERLLGAHDDIVAAGIDGVTGLNRHVTVAIAAHDLKTADGAVAVQVTIVELRFGGGPVFKTGQFEIGE
jgi:hypothetical protein